MRSYFIAITLRHVPTAAIIIATITIAAIIVTPVQPVWGAQAASAVSLSAWAAPADIDQTIPEVRTDIACPLPLLLQGASARVQELVANLHQFSAREQIEHIEIKKNGSLAPGQKKHIQLRCTDQSSIRIPKCRGIPCQCEPPRNRPGRDDRHWNSRFRPDLPSILD